MHLLQEAYADKYGPASLGDRTDRSQIRGVHPDLANAPVYPLILAGLMKAAPKMKYESMADRAESFHLKPYRPDFLISLFNQLLFMAAAVMLFFMARRWFDPTVAWISTGLFLGTDLFWRFSMAGLSTMFLIVIFIALAWCLLYLEEGYREAKLGPGKLLLLAVSTGFLAGLGGLTRYSFGLLIIPVLVFLILFLGRTRVIFCLAALLAFAFVMTPWVVRNYRLSHTPFGTAGFAVYETDLGFRFPAIIGFRTALNPIVVLPGHGKSNQFLVRQVHRRIVFGPSCSLRTCPKWAAAGLAHFFGWVCW